MEFSKFVKYQRPFLLESFAEVPTISTTYWVEWQPYGDAKLEYPEAAGNRPQVSAMVHKGQEQKREVIMYW